MPRVLAAALILAAGGVHLYLWFDYFHRVHVVGALFLVNTASAMAIAVWLIATGGSLALLAGTAYSAGTLAFFAISVTTGLFGYRESLFGAWQEAAAAVELASLAVLLRELIQRAGPPGRSRSGRNGSSRYAARPTDTSAIIGPPDA